MLDENKIRGLKRQLLDNVVYLNDEISKKVSEIDELKMHIHDNESKLKLIKKVLED